LPLVCKSENPLPEAVLSGGVMECVMHQGISYLICPSLQPPKQKYFHPFIRLMHFIVILLQKYKKILKKFFCAEIRLSIIIAVPVSTG
jgi:hypothetical protein